MAGTKANARQALANLEEALVLAGPTGSRSWEAYREILGAMAQVLSLVDYATRVEPDVPTP